MKTPNFRDHCGSGPALNGLNLYFINVQPLFADYEPQEHHLASAKRALLQVEKEFALLWCSKDQP